MERDTEMVPWLNPLICYDIADSDKVPPYPQLNTYTTKLLSSVGASSDSSQQFRFTFFDSSGSSRNSTWCFLAGTSLRTDNLDTNINHDSMYASYLENDISVFYQNTQGPVYMNTFSLTDSTQGPSLALQSYCASFLTGPLDSAGVMATPPYNGNKPASYSASIGLSTKISTIPAIQNSLIDFKIVFTNIYFSTYPGATWVYEIYRQNSQNAQTLMYSQALVLNQNSTIINIQAYNLLCNYTYIMKLKCYNAGTLVSSPFFDITLTNYMGLAFQASRMSGVLGNSPMQTTVPSALATVTWGIRATYLSALSTIPSNDINVSTYVELKLVTTFLNNVRPSVIKGLTLWYNFDGPTGYWPLCVNQPVSNGGTILLRTGGSTQNDTRFDINYLLYLVSVQTPLYFSIQTFALNEGAYCNEEFTGARLSTSLGNLLTSAQNYPNEWIQDTTYMANPTSIRNQGAGLSSILSFQLWAKYTQSTPPVPPVPPVPANNEFGYQELVEKEAIESMQESVAEFGPGRNLVPINKLNPNIHQEESTKLRDEFIFEGNAAKELYKLMFQIEPRIIQKASKIDEIIDILKTHPVSRGSWIFKDENRAKLEKLKDKTLGQVFVGPTYLQQYGRPYYSAVRRQGSGKIDPRSQMSRQEAIYNAQLDQSYYKFLAAPISELHSSPIPLYGTEYDPYNATAKSYVNSFGYLFNPDTLPASEDLYEGPGHDQVVEISEQEQQFLQNTDTYNSWWDQLYYQPLIYNRPQKETQGFQIGRYATHMIWSVLPFLVFKQFGKISQIMRRGPQDIVQPQDLVQAGPQEQQSILRRLGEIGSVVASLKFLADATGLTQVFYSGAHRAVAGPQVLEKGYTAVFGDDLTPTQKVLITTLEDSFVGDFGRFVGYGALATKFMFPDSQFIINADQAVMITRIGALAGVITNPVVQIGAVLSGVYYLYRKAEQTQQQVEREIETKSKIFVDDLSAFARNTVEAEQRQRAENEVFLKQLQQAFEQSFNDQVRTGDETLRNLNESLGYIPAFLKQEQQQAFSQFQTFVSQTEADVNKANEEIYGFYEKNANFIQTAGILGILTGIGTVSFLINREFQERKRQQDREDREREEAKKQKRKQDILEEKERKKIENLVIMRDRKLKQEQRLRFARAQVFRAEIQKAQQDVELRGKLNETTPYTYQNQSQTDKIPFKEKMEIYSSLVIGNQSKGATQDETEHLTNTSLAKTADGRDLFIHSFCNLVTNMPGMFDTYDAVQTSIALSSVDAFLKQAMFFQKLANNVHAFTTFKVFKSIINPETVQEENIQEQLKRYVGINRHIDTREAINQDKKSKIDEIMAMCQQKSKISDMLERLISNTSGSHAEAFNGGQYITQRMRSLGYAPPKAIKAKPESKIRKKLVGFKAFNYVTNPVKRLGRLVRSKQDDGDFLYQNASRRLQ